MDLIEWTDATRVGVDVIDEQHRHLRELINRLYGALQARSPLAKLQPFLAELEAYAQYHFDTEEELMRKYGCLTPTTGFHIGEHGEFRECLKSLKRDLGAGEVTLRLDLWLLVLRWWEKHVLGTDRELARQINATGSGSPAEAREPVV